MAAAIQARSETPEHVSMIRDRYLAEASGDAVLALDRAILDRLADIYTATKMAQARSRLVSRGFVRSQPLDWEA